MDQLSLSKTRELEVILRNCQSPKHLARIRRVASPVNIRLAQDASQAQHDALQKAEEFKLSYYKWLRQGFVVVTCCCPIRRGFYWPTRPA